MLYSDEEAEDAAGGGDAAAVPPRGGVNWEDVATAHGTRNLMQCSEKWQKELCPDMVQAGQWSRCQDAELLRSLWATKPHSVRPRPRSPGVRPLPPSTLPRVTSPGETCRGDACVPARCMRTGAR